MLRRGECPPIFFGLAKENGPCTVQKKNALVPKSCLAAGLGKDGGFSKKAPDISCLGFGLGAGPGLWKPEVVSPRRNVRKYPGCESNWFSLLFPLPLRRILRERSGSGKKSENQFVEHPG